MSRLFYSLTLILFILISIYSVKSEDAGNNYGDGIIVPPPSTPCNNCSICQYPCHAQPPPPPFYAAPPPPSADLGNCPPAAPVNCCGGQYYAPPAPFYYPYNNFSGTAATRRLSTFPFTFAFSFSFSFYLVLFSIC